VTDRYDVIIVGGGHNGLVAGAYLAGSGLRVLLLEARETVGGLCATAELFPGVRGNLVANSAHNFEPKVLSDLRLDQHGLTWSAPMVPSSFITFPDGRRVVSWPDEADVRAEFERFAAGDYAAQRDLLNELLELARVLDVPFFGPPPAFAAVAGRPKTAAQEELFTKVMFGSATDLVRERLASEELQSSLAMLAATGNFLGPATPGTAFQLMHRALYRGSSAVRNRPNFAATADFATRAPIGGMGAITKALANAFVAGGGEIRTASTVTAVKVGPHGVEGVVLADGDEVDAQIVASAINPKATIRDLLPEDAVDPAVRSAFASLEMNGCMAKVYVALNDLPQFVCSTDRTENELLVRCGFRVGVTQEAMQRSFEAARRGDWSGDPIIYGLVQTAFDPTLATEGRHVMSLSVCYAPYKLAEGSWKTAGDDWAKHILRFLAPHIANFEQIVDDYAFLTPDDLESEFGLLEANALHGNVTASRAFNWRPVAGYSDYRGPVRGLYLCSNGTWPALYVSGLAGHNAAQEIRRDIAEQVRGTFDPGAFETDGIQ
jgi:phytoene dehydrogenase-like protein